MVPICGPERPLSQQVTKNRSTVNPPSQLLVLDARLPSVLRIDQGLVWPVVEQESRLTPWAPALRPAFFSKYFAPYIRTTNRRDGTYSRVFSCGLRQVRSLIRFHNFQHNFRGIIRALIALNVDIRHTQASHIWPQRSQFPDKKLDSWGEIGVVSRPRSAHRQRWREPKVLPVHASEHKKNSTVYAFAGELDDGSPEAVSQRHPAADERLCSRTKLKRPDSPIDISNRPPRPLACPYSLMRSRLPR